MNILNTCVGRTCRMCNNQVRLVVDGGAIRAKCEDQTVNGCKWIFWNSPMPVAAALAVVPSEYSNTTDFTGINDYDPFDCDHAVFILRALESFKGEWALPAGFVNPLETPSTAAVRELAEETSLTGVTVSKLGFYCPMPSIANVVVNFSLVKVTGGFLEAGDDAQEAKIDSLAKYPKLPLSSHYATIELFLRKQQSYRRLKQLLNDGNFAQSDFDMLIQTL